MEAPVAPTCLLAVNDIMAMGALAALRDLGRDVPGDVSVAGFDVIPALWDACPPLTTVRLPLVEMGRTAARLAMGDEQPGRQRVGRVRGEVVVRQSTAAPRA
jgi:LacI family transcriptional regulator